MYKDVISVSCISEQNSVVQLHSGIQIFQDALWTRFKWTSAAFFTSQFQMEWSTYWLSKMYSADIVTYFDTNKRLYSRDCCTSISREVGVPIWNSSHGTVRYSLA